MASILWYYYPEHQSSGFWRGFHQTSDPWWHQRRKFGRKVMGIVSTAVKTSQGFCLRRRFHRLWKWSTKGSHSIRATYAMKKMAMDIRALIVVDGWLLAAAR
ncbi:hypothetical protein H112_05233 [Trichophyton rubrum D6]|uniref:Uncharacterized protein n=3 Tax=Trichophyton TaxID=5550 RepID=A0A080WJW7_TRIRC|nr:uncharacterized protein TERG_11927 [Trichophyton rubrum CBS 118892]EZF20194.1 hypothetical protein H100_05255 [Trichophyton rubrum MR850]EZF40758.1 hypothetical protein H102_05245 [Trichophyton rubrum CBS 100081]EZF51375.1 hypothetical protein H103_05246 [Trichophyton rubrum CBS 288.86]EZF62056.1 hypothetical protein H104_05236 [Trichophyton rubrum CBS 289.86]EZF72649.1 hypothetical protein H105_05264 [Trichophyton soudanense CBS 452.61]EZF83429.1 hypothetical protein H110_05243 [Trichophy